jgi:hypothetical protein
MAKNGGQKDERDKRGNIFLPTIFLPWFFFSAFHASRITHLSSVALLAKEDHISLI